MATTAPRNRAVRAVYLTLGLVFLAVAIVGIVLPVIPTTFPTLLAAYFLARSSERVDRWLVRNRVLGPIVRDWRAGAGFTARAKAVAVVGIAASFTFSGAVAVSSAPLRIVLGVFAVCLCAFVLALPTKPTGPPTPRDAPAPPRR